MFVAVAGLPHAQHHPHGGVESRSRFDSGAASFAVRMSTSPRDTSPTVSVPVERWTWLPSSSFQGGWPGSLAACRFQHSHRTLSVFNTHIL